MLKANFFSRRETLYGRAIIATFEKGDSAVGNLLYEAKSKIDDFLNKNCAAVKGDDKSYKRQKRLHGTVETIIFQTSSKEEFEGKRKDHNDRQEELVSYLREECPINLSCLECKINKTDGNVFVHFKSDEKLVRIRKHLRSEYKIEPKYNLDSNDIFVVLATIDPERVFCNDSEKEEAFNGILSELQRSLQKYGNIPITDCIIVDYTKRNLTPKCVTEIAGISLKPQHRHQL